MTNKAAVASDDVVTKISPRSVRDTVSHFVEILTAKEVKLFDVIDQREEARKVGLELRETTLVLFGNPLAGTPVMVASPMSALDLPLKVLIWADGEETMVSYYSPKVLAVRHHLDDDVAGGLGAINLLTDALIAN